MNLRLNIVDWQASAPGLSTAEAWRQWASERAVIAADAPLARPSHLPMMAARRLASGSRQAVECALALIKRQPADALVFASRHGELERNFRILSSLAQAQAVSPTDFTMSVHNAAVGSFSITAGLPLVSSSVAAGVDTFQQALIEVAMLHHAGYGRVLLVDFEGAIPGLYHSHLPAGSCVYPYAVALLLEQGESWQCQSMAGKAESDTSLPQSLRFLHGMLDNRPEFIIGGERLNWHWSYH